MSESQYDGEKIENTLLALLYASSFDDGRFWKGYDFGLMDSLHEKDYITEPWVKPNPPIGLPKVCKKPKNWLMRCLGWIRQKIGVVYFQIDFGIIHAMLKGLIPSAIGQIFFQAPMRCKTVWLFGGSTTAFSKPPMRCKTQKNMIIA